MGTSALDRLQKVWEAASSDQSRIVAYLRHRGLPDDVLDGMSDEVLRFHGSLAYHDHDEAGRLVLIGRYPAMVAAVERGAGETVTLHRTYLHPQDDGKAPVDSPKKLMSTVADGATNGAAIRLFPAGSVLGLAEGIETALAVRAATGQAVWACVSAGGLERVVLPAEVETVHLWADNDRSRTGQHAALTAAKRLYSEGRAVYVHLPKKEGTDWLDVYVGSGAGNLLGEVAECDSWRPDAHSVGVLLSTVKPERVEWLWERRIPLGKVTIIDGDPGLGKSTATLDIAARVSTGKHMPDGTPSIAAAGVVLVSAEDGLADTIVPRLLAAGADLERITSLDSCPDDDSGHPFTIPDDLVYLERAIHEIGARFVVIDPLMAFLGGGTNAHRDQDIRRALARVHSLADSTGAAVALVRHLNKGSGQPIYRGGGSIGIIGAARSGLLVARDPDDDDRRVLAAVKHNLCLPPDSLSFHMEGLDDGGARVVWEGKSTHSAEILLSLPTSNEEKSAREEAKGFLLDLLSGGPVSSNEALAGARQAGLSEATIRRARADLGVKPTKSSFTGSWTWSLPFEDAQDARRCSTPESEHLGGNVSTFG